MPKRRLEPTPPRKEKKRQRCFCLGIASPAAGLDLERCVQQAASTRIFFHTPRHSLTWYEKDMWTEVAKHLCSFDLIRLSYTYRWFHRLITGDDSLWHYTFHRDLGLPAPDQLTPRPLHRSWRVLYLAVFRRQTHTAAGWRIGGLLLDSPEVLLTGKLPLLNLPLMHPDDMPNAIKMTGACVLNNARPGVWVADVKKIGCPGCSVESCKGVMQVLDSRHSELYLVDAYWDGTLEYEDLGEHSVEDEVPAALCSIFCFKRLDSSCNSCLLDVNSWIRKRQDLLPRTCGTTYAVAVNSNLARNKGLLTRFQAMRDTTTDGKIMAVRISQRLI